jgi:sugar (glycoside-pentoside-hexuronide) transporter
MSNQTEKKFPMYKKIIWNLPSLTSNGLWGIMSGYLTFYLTQSVLLSTASVGFILMGSKIFDGFTDLIAGYFIERTTTRWGKGRPYAIFASIAWIFIIMIFAVPSFFSTTGKLVYVLVCYTLINSVALTLSNCSEHVYMIRAIQKEKDKSSTLAIGGVIVTYGSTILAIAMPIAITTLCVNNVGWTILALVIGIPSMILASLKFFMIKELPLVNAEGKEAKLKKVSIKDILKQLIHNKYVLICCGLIIVFYFGQNLNTIVGSYYFTYNIGDLTLLSYISATALITPIVLMFIPKMLEKLGKTKVLQIGLVINLIACIIRAFAPTNLILYAITSIACSMGTLPMVYFIGLLLMDCMDYGEWMTGYRVESGYTAISNAGQKISAGLASGFAGMVMASVGFVSGAKTQTTAALEGIMMLTIYVPIVVAVILLILISCYKLDDRLDQIRMELIEKRK